MLSECFFSQVSLYSVLRHFFAWKIHGNLGASHFLLHRIFFINQSHSDVLPRDKMAANHNSSRLCHDSGVAKAHDGACKEGDKGCDCPNYNDPVCGRDFVTYNNPCSLQCQLVLSVVFLKKVLFCFPFLWSLWYVFFFCKVRGLIVFLSIKCVVWLLFL